MTAPDPIAAAEALAEQRGRIVALAELLGPDELAVLEVVAHGLARGREVYGELDVDADRREFVAEGVEELRDALVYFGAGLVRLQRRRRTS